MKEKQCLITASLISAIDWTLNAPHTVIKEEKGGDGKTTWAEKAYVDLCAQVAREQTEFSEAARKGVEFEKAIYESALQRSKDPLKFRGLGGSRNAEIVAGAVEGYAFYQKAGKRVTIGGNECYLYAKYDAIFLPDIIDLKTTGKYTKNKYLKTFQHKLYCYISGAETFRYVIAEWAKDEKSVAHNDPIAKVHTEQYLVSDALWLASEVEDKVAEALKTLKDLGLWETYRTKFCLY